MTRLRTPRRLSVLSGLLALLLTCPALAQDDGCDSLDSGGCGLTYGQMVSANLPDEGIYQQWQVVANDGGNVTVNYMGDPNANAQVSLTDSERNVVVPPTATQPDGSVQFTAKVDPGFYEVQVVAGDTGTGTPYNLLANYQPPATPLVTPTAVPTQACQVPIVNGFGAVYNHDAKVRRKLGCALQPETSVTLVEEPFEAGHMLWREDKRLIYVTVDNGTAQIEPDTYQGEPDPDNQAPPPFFTPVRGFGKLWQRQDIVTELRWATAPEDSFQGAVQDFANGVMLWTGFKQHLIYVVYSNDDTWFIVLDPNRSS